MRLSGLSIDMLLQYIELLHQGEHTIPQRKEILMKQREVILLKMKELQETLEHLNKKIETYDDVLEGCKGLLAHIRREIACDL